MKITQLEAQRKNKDRLNLYIDGAFHCGLNTNTAARLGLYEGKEVTLGEISNIDIEDEYQKCMNAALDIASRRRQSEREYWQKLGKKYDKPLIGRCLDRLRELGYADDAKFAEMWVRERSKTRGKRLLQQELQIKGIDKSIVENLLTNVLPDNEYESAKSLALKKFKPSASKEENYSKVLGFLTRKGYSYSVAKKVFDSIIADN